MHLPSIWLSGCGVSSTSQDVAPYVALSDNLSTNPLLLSGESFVVTARLIGNAVESQLILPGVLSPYTESISYSIKPCVVSSPGPESCTITVTVESMTPGHYTLTMQSISTKPVALQGTTNIQFTAASCNSCTVFWASNQHPGNLLKAAINLGYSGESLGVLGADYLCGIDTNNPHDGHPYKAFITDGTNRYACTSANCSVGGIAENKDWVLYPLTTYKLTTESVLFQTNESAIWPVGRPFVSLLGQLGYSYFSGFSSARDWTSPSVSFASNCNGWAGSGAPSGVIFGNISGTNSPTPLTLSQRIQRGSHLIQLSSFNSASFGTGSQIFACKGIRKHPNGGTAPTGFNLLCIQQ